VDLHDHEARLTRIRCLLQAAARLADPRDPLGQEARSRLPHSSGLSRAGVELALTRHLELCPSEAELEQLVRKAGRAARCQVLLAANVCTAPLRALAWALATSPWVEVRPSRRDPVVAELLVRALDGSGDLQRLGGSVRLCSELTPLTDAEVHLYGSDQTISAVRASLPAGVRVQAHGSGMGVGAVDAEIDLGAAAQALAEDVVPFDQRGCLSPRIALVQGGSTRAKAFARELDAALGLLGGAVPRGELAPDERAELARFRATATALGGCFPGTDHVIALDETPRVLLLPPALRCLWVAPAEPAEAACLLTPWRQHVTALGGTDPAAMRGALSLALAAELPRARRSTLGSMQRPPLDGPVDLRPLATAEGYVSEHDARAS
jgi:hypothetical protein